MHAPFARQSNLRISIWGVRSLRNTVYNLAFGPFLRSLIMYTDHIEDQPHLHTASNGYSGCSQATHGASNEPSPNTEKVVPSLTGGNKDCGLRPPLMGNSLSKTDIEGQRNNQLTTLQPGRQGSVSSPQWDGPDDPENPQNFSIPKKWLITMSLSTMTVWVTFSTSVFSTATVVTAEEFQVPTEVMVLATTLPMCVSSHSWLAGVQINFLPLLTFIDPGLCSRAFSLGPTLRALWKKAANFLGLCCFRYLPNSGCRC